MANTENTGTIVRVRPAHKYGPLSYDVVLDDGRTIKNVFDLSFSPGPGRRFWPLEEWRADRQRRMDAMVKRMNGGVL